MSGTASSTEPDSRRGRGHRRLRRLLAARSPGWLRKRRASGPSIATLDYPAQAIRIYVPTRRVARLRVQPVAKEPWTVAWMQKMLRDDDVLYDVGANVGVYSLIAAAIAPKAQIVAFEPGYANFAALCDNISLNGARTIVPLPIVLGESARRATLAYSDVSAGSARHVVDGTGPYEQPILIHTIDLLVGTFGVPAPTLVKLDVDGAEAAVLSGAANALARPQLRSLIVEIEDALSDDVCGLLTRAGFTLGERFDTRDGELLPGVWYGIFER